MLVSQSRLLGWSALAPNVRIVLGSVLVALLIGTAIRSWAIRGAPAELAHQRMASLRTWWVIAVLFAAAAMMGQVGMLVLFAGISLLAWREYTTLIRVDVRDWGLVGWGEVILLANYVSLGFGWDGLHTIFVPLVALLLLAVRMVVRDRADGFLSTLSGLYLGMMLTIYGISHAPRLLTSGVEANPAAGPMGWLLFLLLVTELSDISQALVGRRFGHRSIAPVLSPHKTYEGLAAGVVTTLVASSLLAPFLTSLPHASIQVSASSRALSLAAAPIAGLLICVSGYVGDLTISGIKRNLGVKDSGTMLPGQGGILDRIDSLIFTAPVFYYYVTRVLHG